MIREHFKMILSICTFLVLFRSSTQFSLFSLESSDESDKKVTPKQITKMVDKIDELKPNEEKELIKNFLRHLMALAELNFDEGKMEQDMLADLDGIPKFEVNAINVIKKFRKSIDAGCTALDDILEKRKNKTNAGDSEVIRRYNALWHQIEMKKHNEAKAAVKKIDNILSALGNSIIGTVDEQMKSFGSIKQIIKDRKKGLDEEKEDIRKRVESVSQAISTTKSIPQDSLFLLDEEDVKQIRAIYNIWIEKLPKCDIPEARHLLKNVEKSGMSLPMFCKTMAELYVLKQKAEACRKRGDMIGKDVLLKTLEQPNYKKCEQIFKDSPPPSMEIMVKLV